MENAAQALIIAGGVLIGVILLSIAAYLGLTMSEYAANTQAQINRNETNQFNQKFIEYEGLKNLSIQDVVTVKNLALEENEQYFGYNPETDRASSENDYIDVKISSGVLDTFILTKENEELLTKEDYATYKYECIDVELHPVSGRVNIITFKKIAPEGT